MSGETYTFFQYSKMGYIGHLPFFSTSIELGTALEQSS